MCKRSANRVVAIPVPVSCPPPPHLFAGHAAHHDSRKDVVAAPGTRSRTSPLGNLPLHLVERLLVDERREGVLDHDRSIAADGPVADMVEPPLRHCSVEQKAECERCGSE